MAAMAHSPEGEDRSSRLALSPEGAVAGFVQECQAHADALRAAAEAAEREACEAQRFLDALRRRDAPAAETWAQRVVDLRFQAADFRQRAWMALRDGGLARLPRRAGA